MHVLVTGATGFVGGRLAPALLEGGHEVTVLVRDATEYDAPAGVRVIEGDLLAPESLPPAFAVDGDPVDAAYYLVHSMEGGPGYAARDRDCARHFAAAASAAGVPRVVYLGGLGEDRDELSEHLRSRREVERLLAEGTYALTTLRAAIVIGAGSASFEVIRGLATRLPVMITPKWVDTRCQPIAVGDVVAYLVGVLDEPATAGETFEIGGPEVLTYAEILRRTRRQLGQQLRIVRVPVLSPRLSAMWLRLVTDVDPFLARSLVEGMRNPVVVEDTRIREYVPIDGTPFDLAVARALDESRPAGDEPYRIGVTNERADGSGGSVDAADSDLANSDGSPNGMGSSR
ncbi:NAD(P)H-binding protein [Halorubrum sp. JWXQ-INN 858]|uniref:NAD(P)H-binding protein n=1 Tax=Halorubrum sp. JWXQ-INN 858 TaxID=2690782 RepID=UPI00135A2AED|nr:NAD(P)H-binding protein [Halorubrum sp. JWXQ-INN 858]MWV63491.1 NAD(P)H-binding protein [Halorubrum sp. JWXQ-INN 858]